ncbi:MAG: hypothetical protein M1840_001654 [Geoglossum simile]|nr:MAG: hypothetical protein M1840_001654 [Geoglossum simile]
MESDTQDSVVAHSAISLELTSRESSAANSTQLPFVKVETSDDQSHQAERLYLSISGMTCASCVDSVTRKIEEVSGASEVAVDFIGKSAVVVVARKDLVNEVIAKVDEAGFEAELVSSEPLTPSSLDPKLQASSVMRTVSLRVEGMFGECCPPKIIKALQNLGSVVKVEKVPSLNDATIRVSYNPNPPKFTIRHIVKSIQAIDPQWRLSIAHPPSLEERAERMQVREQRRLLIRIMLALTIAIPTFILGVVFMSLVKKSNAIRIYMEEPMWAGRASRLEWALFILSTPVMFFAADIFHRRSIKEIVSLWRRGSTSPVYRRFIRFGSMNLLVSLTFPPALFMYTDEYKVSLGVSIAYFASVALLAIAATLPPSNGTATVSMSGGGTTMYFDSVVFLTFFILSGRYLEAYSKRRTADAVKLLGRLRPNEALLLEYQEAASETISNNGKGLEREEPSRVMRTETLAVDMLEVGDIVRVVAGSSPPSDGTIISEEETTFDESSLTGESKPVTKRKGDQVFAGTINQKKAVSVRVDMGNGETMLDQIVKVVRQGTMKKAPVERIADRVMGYFVPVITLLAILTWAIWLALGLGGVLPPSYRDSKTGGWPLWSLEFAIAVFVVACPCGIALAAPTALFVGCGLAAKYGILARGGGEAFQEISQLDVIVFDKTGTLTEGGQPKVTDTNLASTYPADLVLGIAAELESNSSHPLATAIRSHCATNTCTSVIASEVEETAGRGLKGLLRLISSGETLGAIIGNEAWLDEHGVLIEQEKQLILQSWKEQGKSVVLVAIRNTAGAAAYSLAASFALADPLRKEAPTVIRQLQQQGIATWMISGDNEITAKAVANSVGIPLEHVIAGVLPQGKAEKIEWIQRSQPKRQISRSWQILPRKDKRRGRAIVAMVGDGINDAPALTTADVGIAIGSGSDIAISSAKFILLTSSLWCLLTLMDLSRTVFNRVKFNFVYPKPSFTSTFNL